MTTCCIVRELRSTETESLTCCCQAHTHRHMHRQHDNVVSWGGRGGGRDIIWLTLSLRLSSAMSSLISFFTSSAPSTLRLRASLRASLSRASSQRYLHPHCVHAAQLVCLYSGGVGKGRGQDFQVLQSKLKHVLLKLVCVAMLPHKSTCKHCSCADISRATAQCDCKIILWGAQAARGCP